ncbi:PAS domain-containing protein [Hymenobacter sp. BT770]|uniref:PAS domain-containing protein n=1 Tax=Hymenobacter sp. BT770 TaxID=2886942 RepID=UPI001D12EE7F|nr:PAS domain-containing protein [Hymenobacter sp. BT770]MCC3151718.1 PAS domain-containing protein [Hymenobacter sp. BT770]MDO3413660.1 PAS domain-containing protein [Hymenobacter sp. BT770]
MSDILQLKESEQRFRALFENNPDLVLFQDATGVILDANPAYLQAVEKPREEVVGRTFNSFLPEDLRALFAQKLREAFEGHKVHFDVEVQFLGAPQPLIYAVTKVPLVADGAITGVHAVFRDMTETYNSNRVIREQADKLNTIFESITDAFFLLDREWRFGFVNSEVERLLNVKREQILGRTLQDVFPEESQGVLHEQFENAFRTNQVMHFQAYFGRMQLWLEVKAFPSKEGLSIYFSDVTEKVRSQEELYRQNKDLQQFTYIVSHNLRAPVANALGLVDLLGTLDKDSPDYKPALDNLRASTQQVDMVLRDMNTILSIRDKQGVEEPEQVLLGDIVEQARLNLAELTTQCGGEVLTDIPADLYVLGNRAYLYSIFFNLLSNSLKYRSDERPLRVSITARAQPGQGAEVVVADNGSGFDMEKAGLDVFRLYKRFHSSQPGRGMGLYLVKTHVETMGGQIEVSSAVNVGTQFILHLR